MAILAAGVALTLVVLAVGVVWNAPISTQGAAFLQTALGAVIGVVATYLGAGWGRRDDAPRRAAAPLPPDQPPVG